MRARLGLVIAAAWAFAAPAFADTVTATPAPPTPVAPAPTAAPAPARPSPSSVAPADRLWALTGLTERQGRRIVHEIREIEGAIPVFEEAARTTARDGTEDVVGLYRISKFELCVRQQNAEGTRATRAARAACRGTRGLFAKLVHVSMAPAASPAARDDGGAITILGTYDLGDISSELVINRMESARLAGRDVIALDYYTSEDNEAESDERGGYFVTTSSQTLVIFDAALHPLLDLAVIRPHDTFSASSVDVQLGTRDGDLTVHIEAIEEGCGDEDGISVGCYREPERVLRYRFDTASSRYVVVPRA